MSQPSNSPKPTPEEVKQLRAIKQQIVREKQIVKK